MKMQGIYYEKHVILLENIEKNSDDAEKAVEKVNCSSTCIVA